MACWTASPRVASVIKANSICLSLVTPDLNPYSFLGCWATFCPCVVYGQNRQRLRHLHRHNAPLAGGGDTFSQDCRIYCCMAVPCFYWVFQVCRISGQAPLRRPPSFYEALRWEAGRTSATAMRFVGRALTIASHRYVVAHVRSRRRAGSLSWRRRVSRRHEGVISLRPRMHWMMS